jgi:predicted transcriptional regulator
MDDLFSRKENIQVVRLDYNHAKYESEHLIKFRNLVIENSEMYPNIENWLNNKVIPGLKTKERIAFVGYLDDKPMISAVVKRGKKSKFCHLRIGKDFQNQNLGELFFTIMALEVREFSKEIHFTLPESLWLNKKSFFNSFGFVNFIKSEIQYRNFDEELKCSALFEDVWKLVLQKLPKLMYHFSMGGLNNDHRLLLSIKPKYIDAIFSGKKTIELRRRFNEKWIGENIAIYASKPKQSIVGQAKIKNIEYAETNLVWEKYQSEIGGTRSDFDSYVGKIKKIYVIFLDEIKPYENGIPITQLNFLLNKDLIPPQSYYLLEENRDWQSAISLATLLHLNISKNNMPKIEMLY